MVGHVSERRSLGEKLNHLFARVKPRAGQEYSNEQVASAITCTGVTISQSYIWQLRKSKKDNPTLKHLQALADYFGVPVGYFFDDVVTHRVDDDLERLQAEQERLTALADDSEAQMIAMRAGELSPQHRRQVIDLLDVVYQLEQRENGQHTDE